MFLSAPLLGRGVPVIIKEKTNRLPRILSTHLPEGNEAKELYQRTYNGRSTEEWPFGVDPLEGNEPLMTQRRSEFFHNFNIAQIFGDVVNGRPTNFQRAILYYISTTQRLAGHL